MVLDSLNNSAVYESLNENFSAIFKKLKSLSSKSGKAEFVLDEGNVWGSFSTVEKAPEGERQFEAHKKFIDIHFVLQGEEKFVYGNVEDLSPATEYDSDGDCFMLEGEGREISLKAGEFCIVYPQDAHVPTFAKVGGEALVRGVVKIRI